MKISVVDYRVGNIHNVLNAFALLGEKPVLTNDPAVLRASDVVVLPGVGAFAGAMDKIRALGLAPVLKELSATKAFLGICVGMQLLCDESEEDGKHQGLGIIPGRVTKIQGAKRLPRIGWGSLDVTETGRKSIFRGISAEQPMYFCHSYAVEVKRPEAVIARSVYEGMPLCAAVQQGRVFGVQFHVEKCREAGLSVLKEFLNHARS